MLVYMHAHDYSLLYYYSYRTLCKSEATGCKVEVSRVAVQYVYMCAVKYYNPLIGTRTFP